jgi:predicted amidophosphoribosyltransferase
VHNFKYRGIEPAGRLLAEAMAPLLPEGVALVPLPRVDWRLLRYGIAPAPFLAGCLSRITGLPVIDLLTVPPFAVNQARRSRNQRRAPMFRLRRPPPGMPLILIDDVVTTGGTLQSARQALGGSAAQAVTATATLR